MTAINVAVVGASGYTGLELVKLLQHHPYFKLHYIATSQGDTTLVELHPSLEGICDQVVEKADTAEIAKECELVFLALPHKTSMHFVKELIALNVKVVDLSADYRLELSTYEAYYCEHVDKANMDRAVYGMSQLHNEQLKCASLIANPGCYPICSLLPLLPFRELIKEGSDVIIDAKSGVSGAGKKCVDATQFVKVNENLFAYNPLEHRHAPEIAEKSGIDMQRIFFVPQLLPVTRGMMSTLYFETEEAFDPLEVLQAYYKEDAFVRIRKESVELKNVVGTHFCDITARRKGNRVLLISAIDNLLRGASSQAVANANIMMGLDENLAMPSLAYVP